MLKTIFCRYSLYFIGVITVLSSSSCNLSGHKNDDSPCHNGIIYYSDTTMSGIKDPIAKELFQEGCSYSDKSNFKKAKECFMRADSLSPNTPIILNDIGNMVARMDTGISAVKYFNKALQIDSNYVKTYNNYGGYLNSLKKYKEAISLFNLGLKKREEIISDRQIMYINLAFSYYQLDQNKKALEILDSAKIGLKTTEKIYTILACLEYNIMANTPQVNSDTLK